VKTKLLFSVITALLFNTIVAGGFALAFGVDPLVPVIAWNILSMRPGHACEAVSGLLTAGLQKEIWLADLMEGFYPNSSFLSVAQNWDMWVDNNAINLAEAGADPNVLINNTTYPVPTNDRPDTPLRIQLDTLDTENTRLRSAELVELAYDKRSSVIAQHRKALVSKIAHRAAHAYAPASNTVNTPVLNKSSETSFKFEYIIDLQLEYNKLDAPEDRTIILAPQHMADLAKQDLTLYKAILAQPGQMLFGFKVFTYSKLPNYVKATGVKLAYGAAVTSDHAVASVSFVDSEVMVCRGDADMFYTLKDPGERADIIGFQQRAIALPIRNKYNGAIIH
jgi:hypothetical protein